MKLLKNERAFFRWMRKEISWSGEPSAALRMRGPTAYPCFGYVDGYDDYNDRSRVAFLYIADVEQMREKLLADTLSEWNKP